MLRVSGFISTYIGEAPDAITAVGTARQVKDESKTVSPCLILFTCK